MKLYPRFSLEQHIATGLTIRAAIDKTRKIQTHFPKSSTATRAATRAYHALDQLRAVLDNEVCHLIPKEQDPRNVVTHVYYGTPLTKGEINSMGIGKFYTMEELMALPPPEPVSVSIRGYARPRLPKAGEPSHVGGDKILSLHGQWAVTTFGLEAFPEGETTYSHYQIEAARLATQDWIGHMAEKNWVEMDEFVSAYRIALVLHSGGTL